MPIMPDPTDQPAWTDGDLADPHAQPDKARRVRQMFAAIARRYDLNNRLHSLWRDQVWRRRAVSLCRVKTSDIVADVACGTGDLSLAFAKAGARRVIGLDFTHEMLLLAQHKSSRTSSLRPQDPGLLYADADALQLPLPDGSVDVVSIAFGLRNLIDPARAIGEFYRVLRPGGRLCILEFSSPRRRVLRWAHRLYCGRIMPITASLIAGDRSGAYRYLPRSVDTFLDRPQIMARMTEAGFQNVAMHVQTFGIAVIYLGYRAA